MYIVSVKEVIVGYVYEVYIFAHQDTELLEQFICPHTGRILEATKTGKYSCFTSFSFLSHVWNLLFSG